MHSLEKSGELETEKEYMGKRVRKYYRLTKQGHNTANQRVNEFSDFVATMEFLLGLGPQLNHG